MPPEKGATNWKDIFWPLGGTLLGLLVMPIAIAQYPQFFNENIWVLPLSVIAVVVCWVVPLLIHNRTRAIYSSVVAIPKIGCLLFVFTCLASVTGLWFGGRALFRFHSKHLRESIAAQRQQESTQRKTQQQAEVQPSPTVTPLTASQTPRQHKPSRVPVRVSPIIQLPSIGNLKERTIELSDEIMMDLWLHGWPEAAAPELLRARKPTSIFNASSMPTKWPERKTWNMYRSAHFRFRHEQKVSDIIAEYATLHLKDDELEQIIEADRRSVEDDKQHVASGLPALGLPLSCMEIQIVAERLLVLASHLGNGQLLPVNP